MQSRLHQIGWFLFLICAVLFLASGIRNRDPWSIAASLVFGAAVILFLIPTRGEPGD